MITAKEARKCVLLCAVCHRKVHAGIIIDDLNKYYHFNHELADSLLSMDRIVTK
jgi:hypothetical protein